MSVERSGQALAHCLGIGRHTGKFDPAEGSGHTTLDIARYAPDYVDKGPDTADPAGNSDLAGILVDHAVALAALHNPDVPADSHYAVSEGVVAAAVAFAGAVSEAEYLLVSSILLRRSDRRIEIVFAVELADTADDIYFAPSCYPRLSSSPLESAVPSCLMVQGKFLQTLSSFRVRIKEKAIDLLCEGFKRMTGRLKNRQHCLEPMSAIAVGCNDRVSECGEEMIRSVGGQDLREAIEVDRLRPVERAKARMASPDGSTIRTRGTPGCRVRKVYGTLVALIDLREKWAKVQASPNWGIRSVWRRLWLWLWL